MWHKAKRKNMSIEDVQRLAAESLAAKEAEEYRRGLALANRICGLIAEGKFETVDRRTIRVHWWAWRGYSGAAVDEAKAILKERGYFGLETAYAEYMTAFSVYVQDYR